MKHQLLLLSACLLSASAMADVQVFVEDRNGSAAVRYHCTAGEVVRSFALDVRVSQGAIVGITNFFRGESRPEARGYGIFPAAFRDHIAVGSGTNVNWETSGYTPLAVVTDRPEDTLPGLGSSGVTLEFGALWNPADAASIPSPTGTLCVLYLSEPAELTVAANGSRGGVLSATAGMTLNPVFTVASVDPSPVITNLSLADGVITISFRGGELESAPAVTGPWIGAGNTSGVYTNAVLEAPARFFRVRRF